MFAFKRPRIPPELTDHIIDYLYEDKEMLASCSLVARSWIPASRYHLFRSIAVVPTTAQSRLGIVAFLDLINQNREIGSFIRTLRIDTRSGESEFDNTGNLYPYHILPGILAALPNPRTLTLSLIQIVCQCSYVTPQLVDIVRFKLHRLVIVDVLLQSVSIFIDILAIFSDVEILELIDATVDDVDNPQPPA